MSEPVAPRFQRLFIALPVSEAVKSEIKKAQDELQEVLPNDSVRWTKPELFHLTLRFLGSVAVDRTDSLGKKLRVACHDFPPLQLRAERLGFFPERGFPRVIWVSVQNANNRLFELQHAIQTSTLEFTSESAEDEFSAHVTVGRTKKIRRSEATTLSEFAARMHERIFGEWTVNGVELMRSDLHPDGANYTVLTTIPLDISK